MWSRNKVPDVSSGLLQPSPSRSTGDMSTVFVTLSGCARRTEEKEPVKDFLWAPDSWLNALLALLISSSSQKNMLWCLFPCGSIVYGCDMSEHHILAGQHPARNWHTPCPNAHKPVATVHLSSSHCCRALLTPLKKPWSSPDTAPAAFIHCGGLFLVAKVLSLPGIS